MKIYNTKVKIDGQVAWHRPKAVEMPIESYKYIQTKWNPEYSLFRLSYRVYGTPEYYWLIMAANEITNPFCLKNGDPIKVLLPKYLSEVIVL